MTRLANSGSKNYTMLNLVPFAIDHADYTIVQLTRQDSDRL